MEHIYYFFALIAIIWYLAYPVGNPKKVYAFRKRFSESVKKKEYNDTEKAYIFFTLAFCLWALMGLFTSQWIIFLGLFIYATTIGRLLSKHYTGVFINGVIGLLAYLFIILNKYHLHIDLLNL